jgi:murein DD-endopeptidase MepM/ murein hydrolase activator NlpD
MALQKRKKSGIVRKLRNKFRLVVMNDQTLEEKFSLRLTPMNILVFGGTFVISLIVLTLYLIAFTPLREYIPGYTDVHLRRNVLSVARKADSLDYQMQAQERYLSNLLDVLESKEDTLKAAPARMDGQGLDTLRRLERSVEDSLLRLQMEAADRFELEEASSRPFAAGIGSTAFFTPLKGTITSRYDASQKHFGIDIVSNANEVIKSALDGTVIMANFTSETGYVIGIQHANNIFTFYKHNSALLKKVGDFVKAGEVVAIIGNTGEHSTGPHLHFELWYNGSPVNPVEFISF